MIKVGIYGPGSLDDTVRKQLLRLLLRHPDVDLRCVASPAGNTMPLAELHPVFSGETDLTIERNLSLDGLDVLFVIDRENITPEIEAKYASDPQFRLIVLGNTGQLLAESDQYVYGLPEHTRKALVRGARAAVCPRPEAMLIELALLPMAKNMLLNASVDIAISSSAPLDEAAAEAAALLSEVQPSASPEFSCRALDAAPYKRLDLHAEMPTPIAIEEIAHLYADAYSDHSFVHIISGRGPVDEDLRGSNKCLLRLSAEGGKLIVDASMDSITKGITGNAVHIMNLLFGLYERTGLSI